jgi:hypothetical protein
MRCADPPSPRERGEDPLIGVGGRHGRDAWERIRAERASSSFLGDGLKGRASTAHRARPLKQLKHEGFATVAEAVRTEGP